MFETETDPTREDLTDFFKDLTDNDILEVRVKKPYGRDIVYHVTRFFLDNNLRFMNLALEKSDQVFQQVSRMNLYDCILPVFENGNCVNFVKNIETNYQHYYRYEGEIDVSFLNRYQRIVLSGLNEYSVELYKKALPLWKGKEVFLAGGEWRDYLDALQAPEGIQVTVADQMPEPEKPGASEERILYIIEETSGEREVPGEEKDVMRYDDVMALTFMFSYVISPGCLNPDKKFFVIDGVFAEEGIFGIWDKMFAAARYALAKGYLPVFQIVSSDGHRYSDAPGEDIWNKFFLQPGGYTMKEVHNSSYLALSPNMNLLPGARHIMDQVSGGAELSWPRGLFNSKVKKYIKENGEALLPRPERTLGVLMAGARREDLGSAEAVIDKIQEFSDAGEFDYIYLLAEDKAAGEKIGETFGSRVIFAGPEEQEYEKEPEQTVTDLYNRRDEGLRMGTEYLCAVSLLPRCGGLIVRGAGSGLREVAQVPEENYKKMFVFYAGGEEPQGKQK